MLNSQARPTSTSQSSHPVRDLVLSTCLASAMFCSGSELRAEELSTVEQRPDNQELVEKVETQSVAGDKEPTAYEESMARSAWVAEQVSLIGLVAIAALAASRVVEFFESRKA
ncbi:MAG: hypothetical protein KDD62_10565 [Bdellovibrionales bacterium]|nr:hypothetical protein [Bdellovibrionales bacterium]